MAGIGKPLRLRLFLEGQEVPVVAASVSIGVNQPAAASIQIIPLDEGMDLKPRTMVHLFFLDQIPTEDEITKAKQSGIDEETYKLTYYKLLFSGETVGFAFAQSPMSRNLVLQCMDFSSYWDACHATALEYGPGGNAFYNQSSVYASNASLFDDIVNQQSNVIVGWLRNGKPTTPGLQNVSGLAGGIIKMLEAIGGVPTHFKGVNDFFTFAELRCRLLAQITAEENDSTAARIMSGKVFDEWLRNGLQNIGQQVTFRDMAKLLCKYIYYDFVPNPAAKYEPSIDGTTEKTYARQALNSQPLVANVIAVLTGIISDLSGSRGLSPSDGTELEIIKKTLTSKKTALNDQVTKLSTVGSKAKDASSKVMSAANSVGALYDGLVANSAEMKANYGTRIDKIITDITNAIAILNGDDAKVTVQTGVKSTLTTARLRSQIFRPDCFFAPAPRCNVIFPEHYSQVAYDRSYLSEVTRSLTMVYNTLIGQDQMLADKVMAPNIGLDMKKIQKEAGAGAYRILMPHERHTGIIPRSEWLPNTATVDKKSSGSGDQSKLRGARLNWVNRAALFHFFKYRFGPRRISVAGKFNPYIVCGFPSVVVLKPFIPDSSKLREALKVGEDDTIDSASKKVLNVVQNNGANDVSLGAPTQLLGMVASVTHSVDQTGGSTSVALHHCRKHLGTDDEFVGIFSEQNVRTSRIRVPLTSDSAFAASDSSFQTSLTKALVGITPQAKQGKAGSKTANQQATVQKTYTKQAINTSTGQLETQSISRSVTQSKEVTSSNSNNLVNVNGRIDGVERTVQIPSPPGSVTSGSSALFGAKGKVIGIEVVDATLVTVPSGVYKGRQVYRSVVVHEEINIPSSVGLAPVEEIIRPTWFSPNYSNPKIGENIYMPFFGTTSIIDNLQFTGLVNAALVSTDDVEGTTYDPKQAFEEIQKAETDKQKIRSQLSIEKAINVLSYFYGLARVEGRDVDRFIRDYTERPIATLVDILGTPDLDVSYDSKGVVTSINRGKAGFHSLALDPKAIEKGNLFGLLSDPDKQLPRINNTGKKEPISPVYDVRKEKLAMVTSYITALRKGPGLRG